MSLKLIYIHRLPNARKTVSAEHFKSSLQLIKIKHILVSTCDWIDGEISERVLVVFRIYI